MNALYSIVIALCALALLGIGLIVSRSDNGPGIGASAISLKPTPTAENKIKSRHCGFFVQLPFFRLEQFQAGFQCRGLRLECIDLARGRANAVMKCGQPVVRRIYSRIRENGRDGSEMHISPLGRGGPF